MTRPRIEPLSPGSLVYTLPTMIYMCVCVCLFKQDHIREVVQKFKKGSTKDVARFLHFNGISTFMSYLMGKQSFWKNTFT